MRFTVISYKLYSYSNRHGSGKMLLPQRLLTTYYFPSLQGFSMNHGALREKINNSTTVDRVDYPMMSRLFMHFMHTSNQEFTQQFRTYLPKQNGNLSK